MQNEQISLSDQSNDFPNDAMTDWVLKGEERPVMRDGEIINEPADVEENAPGSKTILEEKDCWFPIHFDYAGQTYTADVLKTVNAVTEYRVTQVHPDIERLPDPFIISSTLAKDAVDFPVNEAYYPREFGLILVKAIGTGCNHSDIALA